MDLMTFLLDRTVAQNEGVTDEAAANRIALLGSVIAQQNMLFSLILVQKLARDEVAARPAPPPPPPPPPPAVPFVAPLTTFDQARKQVAALGFNAVRQDLWTRQEPLEVVIAQEPAPFSDAGPGTDVTLVVARLEDKRGEIALAAEAPQKVQAPPITPEPEPVR